MTIQQTLFFGGVSLREVKGAPSELAVHRSSDARAIAYALLLLAELIDAE